MYERKMNREGGLDMWSLYNPSIKLVNSGFKFLQELLFEKLNQTPEECFVRYPKTNYLEAVCLDIPLMKHALFLVFVLLHKKVFLLFKLCFPCASCFIFLHLEISPSGFILKQFNPVPVSSPLSIWRGGSSVFKRNEDISSSPGFSEYFGSLFQGFHAHSTILKAEKALCCNTDM